MLPAGGGMAPGEGRDFMAIAATGHRTPAPAARARGIIEKEATIRVGTGAEAGTWTFRDEFGGGTRDGSKEPVQATFTGDKFQAPMAVLLDEFVVPFGNAEDFIDRLDPIAQESFFMEESVEGVLQGGMEPLGLAEECVGGLRVIVGEPKELGATIRGDDSGNQKKTEKLLPGEIGGGREFVDEVEAEPATEEVRRC
jgi:hypothetical protein